MSFKRTAVALVLVATFGAPAVFGVATAYGQATPASAVVAGGTAGDDDGTVIDIPQPDGDTNWG
jgi:hypothetical protein